MAGKTVVIDGVGEVLLQKNRRSRSLKITLLANGKVRVSLPMWAPYQTAIAFAKSKAEWIDQNRQTPTELASGMRIGKAHHLYFVRGDKLRTRVQRNRIEVFVGPGQHSSDREVTIAAQKAINRALRSEAEQLLPQRLAELASNHGFTYTSVQVRHLKSRWGSCDHNQNITLNFFLMQLPWELIDYVLLHELVHTKHLHHGKDFWDTFEAALPTAKQLRKTMRAYKPAV